MSDGLGAAGVGEGCESSAESMGREAAHGAMRAMLWNSQSNKEKQAGVNVLCSPADWQEGSA